MSLEKAAKQMKNSFNSVSSLFLFFLPPPNKTRWAGPEGNILAAVSIAAAVNPNNGKMVIIEMNPRVSRSSA